MAEVGRVEAIGGEANQIPPVKPVAETALDLNKQNPPNPDQNPDQSKRPKQRRKRPDPRDTTGRIIDVEV